MKKLFSNKKIQIISTVVMGLILILLFTRGIPYGIKISSESVHDKYMSDAGMYSENILLIYNIILIICIIILNILFCIFPKKKTIKIVLLTCFIICSIFIPVVEKDSYAITIAGLSREKTYVKKYNIIDIIQSNAKGDGEFWHN